MKYHEEAVQLIRNLKKTKRDLIEVFSKIDKSKEYLEYGVNSLFRYATEILGLSESDTYQLTQVVRKSIEVPKLKEAIDKGTLTVEKASRIAPIITKDTQEEWITKASNSTHREIEKLVREVSPKELRKEKITQKTGTRAEVRLNISSDFEEKLKRAKEVFRTTSMEETLLKALEISLKVKDPVEKAKRVVSKKVLRTCEVKIETKTRFIPASVIHQVNLRDNGECQERGCKSKMFTEIHHIVLKSHGGKDELSNLTTLCSMHHALRHHFHRSVYRKDISRRKLF